MNYRSDILHLRPGRKLSGKRLSPHGRSGRRRAASRNQGNWVAATAGAMTWLRVSSSGGIGDAASVSVNAMGRRPGRGRRRARNSSNTTSDEWPGSKGLGPFRLRFRLGERLYETGNNSPFKLSKSRAPCPSEYAPVRHAPSLPRERLHHLVSPQAPCDADGRTLAAELVQQREQANASAVMRHRGHEVAGLGQSDPID